jgi:hypothetical protein
MVLQSTSIRADLYEPVAELKIKAQSVQWGVLVHEVSEIKKTHAYF